MAPGRFLTATVVGGIVLFVVGYLIWGLALMGFFESHSVGPEGMMKAEEDMSIALIFLSSVFYAALLTLTVGVWGGKRSFVTGFSGGLLVGLLTTLSMAAIFLGSMNFMTLTGHLVDVVASGIWAGLGGGVIAITLARAEGQRGT